MNSIICRFLIIMLMLAFAGCQSTPKKSGPHVNETNKDVLRAVGEVADAFTGQQLTEEQKKKLTRDIQKDKDAQSALRSIADAMDAKKTVVKFCPVDGKRFSVDLLDCPIHHIKLEELVD